MTIYSKTRIEWPEDVARLKESFAPLASLPDHVVQEIYGAYSEECFSAGWLALEPFDKRIEDFAAWWYR